MNKSCFLDLKGGPFVHSICMLFGGFIEQLGHSLIAVTVSLICDAGASDDAAMRAICAMPLRMVENLDRCCLNIGGKCGDEQRRFKKEGSKHRPANSSELAVEVKTQAKPSGQPV